MAADQVLVSFPSTQHRAHVTFTEAEQGAQGNSMRKAHSDGDDRFPDSSVGEPYKGGNHPMVWKILLSYLQVVGIIRDAGLKPPAFFQRYLTVAKTASQTIPTFVSVRLRLSKDVGAA